MKKHITKQQLCELLDMRKWTWQELSKATKIDLKDIHNEVSKALIGQEPELHKLFTIGQMMQVLNDSERCFTITPHNNLHIGYSLQYLYDEFYDEGFKYKPTKLYSSPSWLKGDHTWEENQKYFNDVLCDSLFEAVKIVLTK